jgi:hypothetical protein
MKKRLKIALFVLWVLILWLVWLIIYIKSGKAYECPLWTESFFSVFWSSWPVIRECNDCELTKFDYKLWLTSKSTGKCENVKKVCYVCLKESCPGSYCAAFEEIYVKVDNFIWYLLNIMY